MNPLASDVFLPQKIRNAEICCYPEQAVKQTMKLRVIWDTTMFMTWYRNVLYLFQEKSYLKKVYKFWLE